MPADLKQQEETLKLLIKKIDSEIVRFEKIKTEVGVKRAKLEESVNTAGLQPVPIEIAPHSGTGENLEQEIKQHILDLNKLKNFINGKLNVVIKEEELLNELQKKYGKEVGIKKIPGGEFELTFSDAETKKAFAALQKSKKMLSTVKRSVQSLTEEEGSKKPSES